MAHIVSIGDLTIGNTLPFILIAGPCQIQSEAHAMEMAEQLVGICKRQKIGFIYKSSFDKANRTSIQGTRGVGMERGLTILDTIRHKFQIPVITDVHDAQQCPIVAQAVDVLQIPAFLCRQTDLLVSAGKTGAAINVKKGQFLAPWDMVNVAEKIASTGNKRILLCDRGTCFGYNTLINDMRGLPIMAKTGYPVVFDATHSVQQPGGLGNASAGQREYAPILSRAAIAVGVAALFVETHEDPDNAPSDGQVMIPLDNIESLLQQLVQFDRIAKLYLA